MLLHHHMTSRFYMYHKLPMDHLTRVSVTLAAHCGTFLGESSLFAIPYRAIDNHWSTICVNQRSDNYHPVNGLVGLNIIAAHQESVN